LGQSNGASALGNKFSNLNLIHVVLSFHYDYIKDLL